MSDTDNERPKLQKILAQAGCGSRRQVERWIEEKKITVNGQLAHLGDRVSLSDEIHLEGKRVWPVSHDKLKLPSSVWIYHKPVGEVCTRHDPQGRPTVFDRLPMLLHQRWISVGRLDLNTSGLLIFTTDGDLAQYLMHPSSQITRTYQVRVYGKVSVEAEKNLQSGILLEDGMAHFLSLKKLKGEGANQWYEVTLAEGRNREVRRLWESQDIQVNRLVRVAYGSVQLPANLKPGEGCFLSASQANKLKA